MVLQATSPASQLTVIFQMMSVVTDNRPTDRSRKYVVNDDDEEKTKKMIKMREEKKNRSK